MKKAAVLGSDFFEPPFSAAAGVRRSGAVGDRKSNQRQGETDLLTLIAHLCYNKDTDEAHEIAVHGLHLIVGVREPKLCSRPRTTDYNTNVRFVNIFFQKKGRKEAVLYHLARSAPRSEAQLLRPIT